MPGCYGNRKFRGNHVFYCRYFLGSIVYRRDISFMGDLFIQLT